MKQEDKFIYPEGVKTTDDKLRYLSDEIRKSYYEHSELERTSTGRSYNLGKFFVESKKQLRKKSGTSFHGWLKEQFPYITIRSAQRYMELYRCVDLDSYPEIGSAGLVRIKDLIDIVGREGSIVDLLKENTIGWDFNIDDVGAVGEFKEKIDNLINRLPNEKSVKQRKIFNKKTPSLKELARKIASFLDSVNAVTENAKLIQNMEKEVLSQIIDNTFAALERLKKIQHVTETELN